MPYEPVFKLPQDLIGSFIVAKKKISIPLGKMSDLSPKCFCLRESSFSHPSDLLLKPYDWGLNKLIGILEPDHVDNLAM